MGDGIIQHGDGTLQQRIDAGKCPKCKTATRTPIWCESQAFTGWYYRCETCKLEVVGRNIDNSSDAML